ncbi:MAG: hypothetical protein LBF27_17500 [Sphingobacterium sp.]|jgi:ABC-type dipeptide/oligopeptide/nickel transport system ATPase component|nr:hypothetical protein [Sphingobacterium sp.]
MSILEISNIGPIKHVKIELNKINVFMGQQGSGKSVIAKIISYCRWVEKTIVGNQSFGNFAADKNFFINRLQTFHKFEGYFTDNSTISFYSEAIQFQLKDNIFTGDWVNRYNYKRNKVSYIPSERNLVVLPEIEKITFPDNYLRSFLFDWLDARKRYTPETPLKILNLDLEYYYTSNQESYIKNYDNNDVYKLLLTNTSSGIQSITPLMVMVDYLTDKIYEKDIDLSYIEDENKKESSQKILRNIFINPAIEIIKKKKDKSLSEVELINELFLAMDTWDEVPDINDLVTQYNTVRNNLLKTNNTHIVLEEAEQNLFPDSQRFLVYYLFSKINNPRYDHSLTLTTHSPYILYSINNCILANKVHNNLNDDERSKVKCLNSMIPAESISIYQIENGKINSIQNEMGMIESNYFDEQMTKIMDDFYILLNKL